MYISKETIAQLAGKGITVRWYPETTFEEYKQRVWKHEIDSYVNYYKDCVATSEAAIAGRCNVLYNTSEELEKSAKDHAEYRMQRFTELSGQYDAQTLYIQYGDGGEKLIMKKESVKSKRITVEYVEKLIVKNEKAYSGYYGAFALNMQKLLKANGLDRLFNVYPTTYGIGVWVIYNWNAEKDIEKVTAILDARNVEYYNEFSERGWVYRYKVSKRADNVARVAA